MNLISSDTNVWIDFSVIDCLKLPFLLPYQYIMYYDAIEHELVFPVDLSTKLVELGLTGVELSIDEFSLADSYTLKYHKLSRFDCIALAIAKMRNIFLFTGDDALRKAAAMENIRVFGTIGVLDQLYQKNLIISSEYLYCLEQLASLNGKKVRLPMQELNKRIENVKAGIL